MSGQRTVPSEKRQQLLARCALDPTSPDYLNPDQIEAKAAEAGWEPFASVPDPKAFDPSFEPSWTIAMAVAWIATRSLDYVREQWSNYTDLCVDWQKGWHEDGCWVPWTLGTRCAPTATGLAFFSEADEPNFRSALVELQIEFRRDHDLLAFGIEVKSGYWRTIDPIKWNGLEIREWNGEDVAAGSADMPQEMFRKVKIASEQILAKWPRSSHAELPAPALIREGDDREYTETPSTAMQTDIQEAAKVLWPDGRMPARKDNRDNAIIEHIKNRGQTPPSARTIRRAFLAKIGQ